MKKVFLTIASIFQFCILTFASIPPEPVIKAFNQKFPNATQVKWTKENAHEYEASFVLKGEKYAVNYTDKGLWLETESPLTFSQLPTVVQKSFLKAHSATAIFVSKIEQANGAVKYEIEIKQAGKVIEYFYSPNGIITTEKN